MKCAVFLLAMVGMISVEALAQNNRKPKIVGQDQLSTNEDESITILMSNLDVEDRDDWFYPWGFTMTVYSGTNYGVSGHVVTPYPNFSGKLTVEVSVNDGEDESDKFKLEITVSEVNDKPVITGHTALTTNENQAISIQPGYLTVNDPDDKYPDNFTMRILSGTNYTVSQNTVTPASGFSGTLSVNVVVNDGQLDSDTYALPIEVKAVNRVPQITGQSALQVNEDESLTILFSHLIVVDEDSNYPQGFTLTLSAGANYTVSGSDVKPAPDYNGKLIVPVIVNDGKNASKPFDLNITVVPVNDLPRIADLETTPLYYSGVDVPVDISEAINVSDPDGDSIMYAEVGFRPQGYQPSVDRLNYVTTGNTRIRGVFDPAKGTMTLLGQASPAAYRDALRSVSFQTLTPSGESKTLYFTVNDGKSDSEVVERSLVFGKAAVSLDIPTGFTPNGDLANDTWKIVPLKSEEVFSLARIRVYNKMGTVVYEAIGFENEWDGRLNGEFLPADTYYYTIDLNTNTPEGYVKGVVTILR